MVELLMSADRVITAAQSAAGPRDPAGWPPSVIVGHLSQVDELVWMPRIDVMVHARGESPPEFDWWEPDPEATRVAFAQASVDEAAARLLAARTTMVHRLRELTDEEWSATAHHAIFGVIDVEGLLIRVLSHDEDHRGSLLLPD
jgi:hypothetical protein